MPDPTDPAELPPETPSGLPFTPLEDIEPLAEAEQWLVEGFLSRESITVLAAPPKTGKTWVALGLAVGVASGTPALGNFHVPAPGPVLLFPAEDDPRAVRARAEALCRGAGLALPGLPIDIITADQVLLDNPEHREGLEQLIEARKPRLLVLDPLVRLHSGAESYVGHVAELFGYLRILQRRFGLAVVVTHHVAKNRGRSGGQPGLAMRGSGEIHAAYDHGATLFREKDGSIVLTLEHRTAESPEPVAFRLVSSADEGTTFEFFELNTDEDEPPTVPTRRAQRTPVRTLTPRPAPPLRERVLELLRAEGRALSQVTIRRSLRVRNESLTETLRQLQADGLVEHLGRMQGWRATEASESEEQLPAS